MNRIEMIKFNEFSLPLALDVISYAKNNESKIDYENFCKKQPRNKKGSYPDRMRILEHLIDVKEILIKDEKMSLNQNTNFEWLGDELHTGNQFAWEFAKALGFKDKIGRKFNDENKKKNGLIGEKYVVKTLKEHFSKNIHSEIKHISLEDDTAGYDIESPSIINVDNKSYLEVKTSSIPGSDFIFYISRNEFECSLKKMNNWFLILIKIVDGKPIFFGKLDTDFINTYIPKEPSNNFVKWESLKVTIRYDLVNKSFI